MAKEIPIQKMRAILDDYDMILRDMSNTIVNCRKLFEQSPLVYASKEFKQVNMRLEEMEKIETNADALTRRMYEHLAILENYEGASPEQWDGIPRWKVNKIKETLEKHRGWFFGASKEFKKLLPDFEYRSGGLEEYLRNIVYADDING